MTAPLVVQLRTPTTMLVFMLVSKIAGINAEVMPGQWEYQVGPSVGIESGDHMWMSRYLMLRVCELLGVNVTFGPKPATGDWNGAGCHTNFSTKPMREDGGYKVTIDAVEKLGVKHMEHIKCYGEGDERRLTGARETVAIDKFSCRVANRGASIRIPTDTESAQKGYFEDRRPASNMDPYAVTGKIFETTCLSDLFCFLKSLHLKPGGAWARFVVSPTIQFGELKICPTVYAMLHSRCLWLLPHLLRQLHECLRCGVLNVTYGSN